MRDTWTAAQRVCLDFAHLLFGLPFRLRVRGAERVPRRGGVLVIANHASVLDPIFMSLAVPRPVHYLVKPLPAGFDGVHVFYKAFGCIETGTGRALAKALATSVEHVAVGRAMAVFPEGGVSPDGGLQAFGTGAARIALSTGCPVVPAWISGTREAMPGGAALPRLAPVTIRFGAAFRLAGDPHAAHRAASLGRATATLRLALERLGHDANHQEAGR